MRRLSSLPRPLLLALAVLFAGVTLFYSILWMYYARHPYPTAQLGITYEYDAAQAALRVTELLPAGPAARAGLQVNDRIVAINSRPLRNLNPLYDAVTRGRPGDHVRLDIRRPSGGEALTLSATLAPAPSPRQEFSPAQAAAIEMINSYPVLFLAVGIPVLFVRLRDLHAWLLALVFSGFIAGGPVFQAEPFIHPALRGFALAYKVVFFGLFPALFYYFFAVFPKPSPLDRRLRWLKTALLVAAALVALPLGAALLWTGSSRPADALVTLVGSHTASTVVIVYAFGAAGLGFVSLVWNSLRGATPEARRKTRVIVWGTVVGFGPFLLLQAAAVVADANPYGFSFWVWAPCILAIFLVPLSFAYAVVKYRVLEIPALLKRSVRYLLVQRGFTLLVVLSSLAVALVAGLLFVQWVVPRVEFVVPVSVGFGISFGLLLAWAGVRVEKRVTERIDRAFFRSAYDARHILEDLAEKTRTTGNREELAALLQFYLNQALLPRALVVYLEGSRGHLEAARGRVLAGLENIPPGLPLLEKLAALGKPWDVPPPETKDGPDLSFFAPLQPECFVPILGRQGRLIGLVVLGPRLSEEPYSGEDKRLLASAASQAGIALDSIRLAEDIARRMQAEQRVAHEMAIAKQVQEKLLPQNAPPLATLDYTGACVQARTVGGDYYDFLDLGPGRLGLVLADIAGKGIHAALLMANLQANLRSQYALALEDVERLLQSVNRLFYDSTAANLFATFFAGFYDDATRRLRYANCGHNPPVLLRADGRVERLEATGTVLGLFIPWECEVQEVQLAPGDTLVIFSDGATEAMSDEGEEFGDERLVEAVKAHRQEPPPKLLSTLVETVQVFSGREQEDDLTLLVARAR
jgi:sigma-B regulation protein RsbU (phosphoserine phosphatase)